MGPVRVCIAAGQKAGPEATGEPICASARARARAPRRARLSRVRVYLGSDHAGFELKSAVAEAVAAAGHDVVDCGPPAYHEDDDYPPYVMRAAASAAGDPGSAGIVIGGSGNGEQMAANKIG